MRAISDISIPARIVFGVTGHRRIDDIDIYAEKITEITDKVKGLIPPLQNTPITFCILSPLAEGADRLVARQILAIEDSQLEVVLPLEQEDYVQDFKNPDSREEFDQLLSRANRIHKLPQQKSREEAYAKAGEYVVDNCDILITLWDGSESSGKGGTAEIVNYARENQCPLFWINTQAEGAITYEEGKALNQQALLDLERYNAERVPSLKLQKDAVKKQGSLEKSAEEAQFSLERLTKICKQLLPHFIRSDFLALKYQHLYYKAGSIVYALAAGAVGVVTFQVLFLPEWPRIVLIEVLFILAVLAIYRIGSRQKWHTKWIDYRFLAERFRSSLFMAISGINVIVLRPPRHLSLSYSSQDWMVAAFSSVWKQLSSPEKVNLEEFKPMKEFLLEAWVGEQIDYYQNTSLKHLKRYKRMQYAGNILLVITLVIGLLHVFDVGPEIFKKALVFLAIVFPALAGALGAIRTHREYLRNAKRAGEMVRHLEEFRHEMEKTESLEEFIPVVKEIEETILHENEDWRVVVRFHELEPAA